VDSLFRDMSFDLWPIGIVLLVIPLIILWRRKHSASYLTCFSVFGIYLVFALQQTFFPLQIAGSYVDTMRQVPLMSFVNLIPFYFGPFGTLNSASLTMIHNVILTIPFGFGVNFVAQVRAKTVLWLALAVGFGIETAQLAISLILRYPYRVIDINDVLMNACGVLIGYGIFRVFARLYLWMTQHFSIKHMGLAAYISDVASRALDR